MGVPACLSLPAPAAMPLALWVRRKSPHCLYIELTCPVNSQTVMSVTPYGLQMSDSSLLHPDRVDQTARDRGQNFFI